MPIWAERVQAGRQSAIVTPGPARLASQADGTQIVPLWRGPDGHAHMVTGEH
jgi:hypothetical protein